MAPSEGASESGVAGAGVAGTGLTGTGRAGTSFLVRYLTAAGLDTTLARQGALAFWDGHAHAGLEEMPVSGDPESLPYVIKTPWLHEIIEKFAADRGLAELSMGTTQDFAVAAQEGATLVRVGSRLFA